VDAYTQLKMDDLAADAQRVLDLNPVVTGKTATKKPATDS
jgi:outer membrane protein assembly factor BamD (BamD/ComL family)